MNANPDKSGSSIDAKFGRAFAGRAEELAVLEDMLQKARARAGTERVERMAPGAPKALVAVVRGEPGIGKSRLIEHFLERSGAVEFRGEAAGSGSLPYHCITTAICRWAGTIPMVHGAPEKVAETLEALEERLADTPEGAALAEGRELLLHLAGDPAANNSANGPDSSELKPAMMIAMRSLIEAIARDASGAETARPVALVLDDVQWAKEISLDVLDNMLGSLASHLPVATIVIGRPEWEIPEEWRRNFEVAEIELKPLIREEAAGQLSGLIGDDAEIPDAGREWLLERAKGSPFYLEELVLGAARTGALIEDGAWHLAGEISKAGIPETLDELIAGHLADAGDELKGYMQIASVLGHFYYGNIIAAIYAALAKLNDISPIFRELIERNQLRVGAIPEEDLPRTQADLPYFFRHALLKDGAYAMMTKLDKKLLHRLAAEAIEDVQNNNLAHFYGALAGHWEEAGEPLKAVEYIEKTLDAHGENLHSQRRIDMCDRAFALLNIIGEEKPLASVELAEYRASICIRRATAYRIAGKLDDASNDWETALALNRENSNAHGEASALDGMGKVSADKGEFVQALECHKGSLALRRSIGHKKGIATSLKHLGNVHRHLSDLPKALVYLEEGLAISKALQDRPGIAEALEVIGTIHSALGNFNQALKYHEESLYICSDIGNKTGISQSNNNIALVYLHIGRYKEAMRHFEECLATSIELGDRSGVALGYGALGATSYWLSGFQKAQQYYEKSLEINRDIGSELGICENMSNIGLLKLRIGDIDGAKALFEQSLVLRTRIGAKDGIAHELLNIGHVYRMAGDYARALELLHDSLAIAQEIGSKYAIRAAFSSVAEVYLHMGKHVESLEYRRNALDLAREIGDKNGIARCIANIGVALYSSGEYVQTLNNYSESMWLLEELDDKLGLSQVLTNSAGVYEILGDAAEALRLLLKGVALSVKLKDPAEAGWGLHRAGKVALLIREVERARGLIEKSHICLEAANDLKGIFESHADNIWTYIISRQVEAAKRLLGEAEEMPAAANTLLKASWLALNSRIAADSGDADSALSKADKLVSDFETVSYVGASQIARIRGAEVYLACANGGDAAGRVELIEKAEGLLGRALEKAEETGRRIDLPDIYNALATACELRDDTESAEAYRTKAEEIRESFLPDPEEKERLLTELDRLVGEVEKKFLEGGE